MSSSKKYHLLILFTLSIVYTAVLTQVNIEYIKRINPENKESNARSLMHNHTVYSIDNYWYVNHFKNFIEHGKFTVDVRMDKYEVRRTPVYPLFFGIHYWLFGEKNVWFFVRISQMVLLALAVVALYKSIYHFTANERIALLAAILYGAFPVIPIASSYTNAESISTELVCFSMYFLSLCYVNSSKRAYWFIGGIAFALAVLCRPSNIFLSIPVIYAVLSFGRITIAEKIKNGLTFGVGALLLFAPWTIRNYKVTEGDIVFLEKYYGDPMDYGMPHIHFRNWVSCWINPADYSCERISNDILNNVTTGETIHKQELLESYLNKMPESAFKGNSRTSVYATLNALYDYYKVKTSVHDNAQLLAAETRAIQLSKTLRGNFIKYHPLTYYIITPLQFVKSVVFQSNSNSMAFLDNAQGNVFKTVFKAGTYLYTVLCYLSVIFLIIYYRKYSPFYGIAVLFVLSNTFGIIFGLRYFEARYNLPLFPYLSGLLSIMLYECQRLTVNFAAGMRNTRSDS